MYYTDNDTGRDFSSIRTVCMLFLKITYGTRTVFCGALNVRFYFTLLAVTANCFGTYLKYYCLSERCMAMHNGIIWQLLRGRLILSGTFGHCYATAELPAQWMAVVIRYQCLHAEILAVRWWQALHSAIAPACLSSHQWARVSRYAIHHWTTVHQLQ